MELLIDIVSFAATREIRLNSQDINQVFRALEQDCILIGAL